MKLVELHLILQEIGIESKTTSDKQFMYNHQAKSLTESSKVFKYSSRVAFGVRIRNVWKYTKETRTITDELSPIAPAKRKGSSINQLALFQGPYNIYLHVDV